MRCNSDAENDAERADPQVDYSPAGVADIEDTEKQYVARCVDKMGEEFLANVGTVNVARDLDRLRAALGDDKLTYLGYSYGTRIGAAYAEAFPDKVRAMILDGAVDPTADPIQSTIDQAEAFQEAFDDYAADCAEHSDCPLGTDPDKAVDVYKSLVDPLVKKPAHTDDPRGLGYSDAIVGTITALYSPEIWRHLTDGLTELAAGHGDTLLMLSDAYMGRDEDGHYTNANDAQMAISCVDEPPVTDRTKVIEEDRRLREVAPFLSYGQFTGDAPLDTCAFWPVPPTGAPHQLSAPGCRPYWWCPPPATRPPRMRPVWTSLKSWVGAVDLRRHPAHRRLRRRDLRRQIRSRLPGRPGTPRREHSVDRLSVDRLSVDRLSAFVKPVDPVAVLVDHHLALELQTRRQLAGFHRELAVDDCETLDLLPAVEMLVELLDVALDRFPSLRIPSNHAEVLVAQAVRRRPVPDAVRIQTDQGHAVGLTRRRR